MQKNIQELLLEKIDKSQIKLNEPMNKHTSFKIGGPADIFIKIKKIEELKYILRIVKEQKVKLTIIRKWYQLISKRWAELEE